MKKPLKILGIAAAVMVLLVVSLIVLARLLITPERIRTFVLPKAEAALHREISLREIEVGLFSGITLGDLVVKEKEGGAPFISAGKVVLRYKIWPLLFRRVVIDEVRLVSPRIQVQRLADGTFNFSDLLPAGTAGEVVPPEEKEPTGPPVDLLVSEVAISGGELLFIDHQMGGKEPYRLQLADLSLSARNISLIEEFPFEFQARLGEGTLKAEGKANPQSRQGSVQVAVAGLDLTAFAPYFREKVPGELKTLKLGLTLTAEGGQEAIRSQGEIILSPIDLTLTREGKEPLPLRNASLALNYAIDADLKASRLQIEKGTVTFNNIPLHFSGRVENYSQAPGIDLQVELPPLDIGTALAALPPELAGGAKELQPAGKIGARLHLTGAVAEPKKLLRDGTVDFSAVEATVGGGRVAVNGVLRLKGETLKAENFTVAMGQNRAQIELQAENLLGDIIRVRSAIRADRFALDPLLQTSAAPAAPGKPQPAAKAPKQGEPLDLPLLADGTVRIGETTYKGLSIRDFDLQYHLENNLLTVQKLQGKVAEGSFGGTGAIDLGRPLPTYNARLQVKGVQADPIVTAFWPKAAGTVFGSLNLQTVLAGKGTDPAVLKKNLTAQGDILLTDGKLTGAGLVQGLADFLNLEQLRTIGFDQAKAGFTIQEGKLLVDSTFNGKDLRLQPQGAIGLEDWNLDLALNLRTSPEIARRIDKGRVTQLLVDQQGWTQIPVKAVGTISSPRFSLDTAAVGEQVREKAGEEVRKRLQRELEKRFPTGTSEPATPGNEPSKNRPGLEESLRGLFGH